MEGLSELAKAGELAQKRVAEAKKAYDTGESDRQKAMATLAELTQKKDVNINKHEYMFRRGGKEFNMDRMWAQYIKRTPKQDGIEKDILQDERYVQEVPGGGLVLSAQFVDERFIKRTGALASASGLAANVKVGRQLARNIPALLGAEVSVQDQNAVLVGVDYFAGDPKIDGEFTETEITHSAESPTPKPYRSTLSMSLSKYLLGGGSASLSLIEGTLNTALNKWITYHVFRKANFIACLLYTSPSPRDRQKSRMPSSA